MNNRLRRWIEDHQVIAFLLGMGLTFVLLASWNEWDDNKDDARIAEAGCLTSLDTRDRIVAVLVEFRSLTEDGGRTQGVIDHQLELLAQPTPLCTEVGIDTPKEIEDAMNLIETLRRHRLILASYTDVLYEETP